MVLAIHLDIREGGNMRYRNIHQVLILLTALLIVILGSGAPFAQGKSHGGNKGGGENRGGGQSAQSRRQNGQPKAQQQQRNERSQAQQAQRQQQRNERPPPQQAQRQQQRNERPQTQQAQGQQQRSERPQFQRREQRQEQRGQNRYERPQPQREQQRTPPSWQKQEQRQQTWRVEQQRRSDVRQIPDNRGFEQWRNRIERDRNNGEARKQKQKEGKRDWQRQIPWSNAWPNNYGYKRSNEVHARNAERKAWKVEEKALRSNHRNNRSYAYQYQIDPYYRDNRYVYQYPQHPRAGILRSLIANVLGSNTGYNNDNYYLQAQPVYYDRAYYPENYGGTYYNTYPQYQSYAVAPSYYSNQLYGYAYDPQYSNDPYYADYYSNDLSFSNFSNLTQGGGFVQQLFSKLLALGYDQGYNEGLNARRAGYGDRYYSDPYAYGDTDYVSYSNSLGENRRCLSDGYELGYNDALYNQRGSDPYQYNSNVDLVSLLIGSVLQGG
jgi:hypothetical protein